MTVVWINLGIVLTYLAGAMFFLSKAGNPRWDQRGVRLYSVYFPVLAVIFTVVMLINLHAATGR